MWRALGWMMVAALCGAVDVAAGEAAPAARLLETQAAFEQSEEHLRTETLAASEHRLTGLLQTLRAEEERVYALLQAYPGDARVRRLALSAALLRKGRSMEETAHTSRLLHQSLGAQGRASAGQLRALRSQLATLELLGPGALAPAEYQARLKLLASQSEALETALAQHTAPLRALTSLPPASQVADHVAAALPQDAALVEFITYEDGAHSPEAGSRVAKPLRPLRYLALVLFPNGRIRAADLGPAAPIHSATSELWDALASRDAAYLEPAQRLFTLAFQPLLPLPGGTRRLFLATDGQLGLVPFDALHDGRRFLLEAFDFTYLHSGRELLHRTPRPLPSSSLTVIADPTPGPPRAPLPSSLAEVLSRLQPLPWARPSAAGEAVSRPAWPPLPGTRLEALAIQRLIPQAQLFLGPEATRERLLRQEAPGVLHIATHGFFLDGAVAPAGSRALGLSGASERDSLPRRSTHPLLRSGLVLSGSHTAAASPWPGYALLTALELASLNLWGTQLAVLSACDTGRGEVLPGQGVYGLRRALTIAGAETVVLSLWQVNDETTRLLMEHYYRHLLAGQGRAAALRNAMRAVRETHPHPHYWAPFIALGRDSPLQGLGKRPPRG